MIKDVSGTDWQAEHLSTFSRIVAYKAHEPHEGCTGNLIVVNRIEGNLETRKAIADLIIAAPSMLALLEKALPIIEEEAERRHPVPRTMSEGETYWTEMRELSHEIAVEIDKAYGKENSHG